MIICVLTMALAEENARGSNQTTLSLGWLEPFANQ